MNNAKNGRMVISVAIDTKVVEALRKEKTTSGMPIARQLENAWKKINAIKGEEK